MSNTFDSEFVDSQFVKATGDSDDFLLRLKRLIPGGWFSVTAPARDVVLGGIADDLEQQYSLLQAVRSAARLATTTGWLLDLAVQDFFGQELPRKTRELDDIYRARFVRELFRERVTKRGIAQMLFDLTGRQPKLFEMFSPGDCGGGYGVVGSQMGYGVAGSYGSILYPNQIFITVYRPVASGVPYIAGYGVGPGGYGSVGSNSAYASIQSIITQLTDDEIYQAVAAAKAAGVVAWVDIRDSEPVRKLSPVVTAGFSNEFDEDFAHVLGQVQNF